MTWAEIIAALGVGIAALGGLSGAAAYRRSTIDGPKIKAETDAIIDKRYNDLIATMDARHTATVAALDAQIKRRDEDRKLERAALEDEIAGCKREIAELRATVQQQARENMRLRRQLGVNGDA